MTSDLSRHGWDHALAERAWRSRSKPTGPQNWEGLEDSFFDYTRADGLEDWIAAADRKLDEDRKSTISRITILDGPVRQAALEALGSNPDPFWISLIGALVLSTWDMARRLSGMPELCVIGKKKPDGFPFANLHEALTFYQYGHPGDLGGGAPQPAVALDRDEDLQLRGLFKSYGIDTVPCKPTHIGGRYPRGLGQLDLWLSVDGAIDAGMREMAHPDAFIWLQKFHVGETMRVSKKKKLGDVSERWRQQWAPVKRTAAELAAAEGLPEHVVREALKQVRRRVTDALVARELIPPPQKQATRARRPRPSSPLTPEWTP